MTKEEVEKLVEQKTAEITNDSHPFINSIIKSKNCDYQTAMHVYLFTRIAILELHIEKLIKVTT